VLLGLAMNRGGEGEGVLASGTTGFNRMTILVYLCIVLQVLLDTDYLTVLVCICLFHILSEAFSVTQDKAKIAFSNQCIFGVYLAVTM
jgi:hypothetical protein